MPPERRLLMSSHVRAPMDRYLAKFLAVSVPDVRQTATGCDDLQINESPLREIFNRKSTPHDLHKKKILKKKIINN